MDKYGITRADNIVIVMGPTGAGKSTFIDYAAGANGHGIGHPLRSSTSDITVRKANIDNQSFAFVDTPGFDDTTRSDYEILGEIAEFLVKAHQNRYQLNKILYLHRISDNRMAGTPLRNLELFASLCGNIAMPNVTIVTTMWSLLPGDIGHQREVLLSATFWQKMIEAGCDIARFGNSAHSARRIALETGSRPNMTLLAQELVHKRKKLKSTEVGITLNKQLDRLVRDKKEASSRLEQMSRQKIDEGARHALELELRAMKKFIEEKSSDLQRLKRSVLSRICKSFVESQSPVIRGPAQILPNQLAEE